MLKKENAKDKSLFYSIDESRIKFSGRLVEHITCLFDISVKTLTLNYDD